ncbi:hypothetical protein [Streptomyces sp. NPDC048196]|uniref:alpha/beta fold hydrolase n=1 Tax=Streptomyces sp. NPDC048196 TaxID=3154712 RepID=UPI0033E3932E
MTSAERQRAFAARIPGSRLLTVPDTEHRVVLERAEDVAELAARFFTTDRWSAPPRWPRCRARRRHRLVAALSRSFLPLRWGRPGPRPRDSPGLSPAIRGKRPLRTSQGPLFLCARGLRAGPRGVSGVTPAGVPSGARGRFRVMPGTRRTSRTAIPSRGPQGSDACISGKIRNLYRTSLLKSRREVVQHLFATLQGGR